MTTEYSFKNVFDLVSLPSSVSAADVSSITKVMY